MVAVVVAVQMAVTRSYRSSLKREPHEVNGYMIGPGADLNGSDLGGALLSGANLIGARANKNTTWPDGFDPVAAGVTFE